MEFPNDFLDRFGLSSKFETGFGEVAEWLKAATCKGCYAAQKVASEVRILPLSATYNLQFSLA